MNIVIPTYHKHYQYNVNFLESFRQYCLDKNDVKISFIVSSNEYEIFKNLNNIFSDLNIAIIKFSDLLYNVDGENYSDNESFFTTKYPIQSLKKLFAFSCVDSDYIVFDSENLCLKPFYFNDIFKSLKEKPIIYCDEIYHDLQIDVLKNTNKLLHTDFNHWFFIKSYWFYELEIVNNLITELKTTHQSNATLILKDITFFEYQLYSQYVLKYKLKNFIKDDDIIQKEFDFKKLLNEKKHNFEYITTVLNIENVIFYNNILNSIDERIVRLHWIDEKIKNKIIDETNVCIGTFHWD